MLEEIEYQRIVLQNPQFVRCIYLDAALSRCQQRARRCACQAAEVVAQRPHGCVARRRAGLEHPEQAGVMVTTVVPLPVGKHYDSGSFASRLSPAAATTAVASPAAMATPS